MRIVASPEAVEFVRSRGGTVFVWTLPMRYGYGFQNVFALEASTDSPGPEREFVRFRGAGIDLLLDAGAHEAPESIHLAVVGRFRKRVRAYWNGNSFGSAAS